MLMKKTPSILRSSLAKFHSITFALCTPLHRTSLIIDVSQSPFVTSRPDVKQINADGDSAWLVRGEDTEGNFIHETPPEADMDAAAMAEHDRIMELRQDVLYKGVDGKPAHIKT